MKGYQGKVRKSATVLSDDPRHPKKILTVEGKVRPFVQFRPSNAVTFQGLADQIAEQDVEMIVAKEPLKIVKLESNLDGKIDYRLETVEEGKAYRLKVSNKVNRGTYRGFIKAHTDSQLKPELLIQVQGIIEGEIAVKPQVILVGKVDTSESVRQGKVLVLNNQNKPFRITRLDYDEQLIQVAQQPLPEGKGYSLEITPRLENVPQGPQRREIPLTIETDVNAEETHVVRVHVVHP